MKTKQKENDYPVFKPFLFFKPIKYSCSNRIKCVGLSGDASKINERLKDCFIICFFFK